MSRSARDGRSLVRAEVRSSVRRYLRLDINDALGMAQLRTVGSPQVTLPTTLAERDLWAVSLSSRCITKVQHVAQTTVPSVPLR